MNKSIAAAVSAAAVVVGVAGCHTADDASAQTTPATTTQTLTQTQTQTSTVVSDAPDTTSPAADPVTPATAGDGRCLDPNSPVVTEALAGIGTFYGRGIVADKHTDAPVGSCPDLMWVDAVLDQGTGSSPTRVLFFDANGFVRYDTEHETAFSQVTAWSNSSVSVTYRWLGPGDATANPTGGPVVVNYRLAGDEVVADRDVPAQAWGEDVQGTPSR
ncbi:LppP/LprE family lipoprotein [Gordonia humi]|uniref:LppP/LprE lipoprotein n=1 Tax=Gordonia humi TaxID=686429 RepID=A0A840EZM7_9ACTN|nr:LppP/LprE family lipoprotein [Gordonia humi]MBB4135758.1 hypothetical protein [Gordonia humi]